jgi:serine/threonine protein phosphatase 1
MRILAIGDMHGCLTAFDRLLGELRLEKDDLLITLGDYVDRGPDSKGVLDRLLQLQHRCTLLPLRGNHEIMMLRARQAFQECQNWRKDTSKLVDPSFHPPSGPSADEKEWLACGGREALLSYGGRSATLAHVPADHWEFLELTCDWYETERHFFVHANAYPDMPLDAQPSYMLHWEKLCRPVRHCSGKIMVCGHSPQASGRPRHWPTTICLDTGVYRGGWLSCLDVTSGRLWQTNEEGQLRTANIDEFLEEV